MLRRVSLGLRLMVAGGLVSALLAVSSGKAEAQVTEAGSLAMRWNDCYGGTGVQSRNFACDTNSGVEALVISVYMPVAVPQLNGADADIQIVTTGGAMPSWWQYQTGGCRAASPAQITGSFTPPAGYSGCTDYWGANAAGGLAFNYPNGGLNTNARARFVCSTVGTRSVPAGSVIFIGQVVFTHQRTVGTGSCAGCPTGTCIGLARVGLTQPPGVGDFQTRTPIPGTDSDVVGWQMSGVSMTYVNFNQGNTLTRTFTGCTSATDAARPTWGAIKRLYH